MARTKRPAQMRDQSGWHRDERRVRNRIHFFDRWREYRVHSALAADLEIRFQCVRVAGVILIRPELQRVYENADDHKTALLPRRFNEAFVTGMKGAHSRHEADYFAGFSG